MKMNHKYSIPQYLNTSVQELVVAVNIGPAKLAHATVPCLFFHACFVFLWQLELVY